MLTLIRRRRRSIYSLSGQKGKWASAQHAGGHTGVGRPTVTSCPRARGGPDVRCLSGVRCFGSGQDLSVVWSGSVVRRSPFFRCFGSGVVVPVVRWGSVVRTLGGVGRPVGVSRPAAGACAGWDLAGRLEPPGVERPRDVGRPMSGSFKRSFFLSIELGVLAVLSVGCS